MKQLLALLCWTCVLVLVWGVLPRRGGDNVSPHSAAISTSKHPGAKSLVHWHQAYFASRGEASASRYNRALRQFGGTVLRAAMKHQVDPELIWSIMEAESGLRENALSPRGAMGLMQLMPPTAKEVGVEDIFNPHQNIFGGARYFRQMLDRFDGDVRLALAAYNAGPGNVEKYKGVPPYKETQRYIKKVLETYQKLKENPAAQRPA